MSGGLHDQQVTPAQAKALGEWVYDGPDAAPVLLRWNDNGVLIANQGDDMRAFHTDGAALDFE